MDCLSIHCIVFQMDLSCWSRSMPLSSILSFFFNDFLPVFKLAIFPNHISKSPLHALDVKPYIFHGLTLNHVLLCGMLPSGCFLETLPIPPLVNVVSALPLCPACSRLSVMSATNAYCLQSENANSGRISHRKEHASLKGSNFSQPLFILKKCFQ